MLGKMGSVDVGVVGIEVVGRVGNVVLGGYGKVCVGYEKIGVRGMGREIERVVGKVGDGMMVG